MEHISVKKKNDRLFISHKIEKTEQINAMELDIISRNEIPALLPVHIRKTMLSRELQFVVQDFTDLRTFLKSDIRFELFAQIVSQIIDALQACESHGIRCGNLELSSDLTFYDYNHQQVRLIYWPLISLSAHSRISRFFEDLGNIYSARKKDRDYRLKYLQFFDSREKFELDDFKTFMEGLLKQWQDEERTGHKVVSPKPNVDPPPRNLQNAAIQRVSNQTMIPIARYPFTIGRRPEFCDYAIEEDEYISKRHAAILLRNGQTYIRDLNTANGIKINGNRIPANTDVVLLSGVTFRIGREDFIFYAAGG